MNEVSYFGFHRGRGDASRVDTDSNGVPALLLPTGGRDLHIASAADFFTDWNVANPGDPTVYIHSETTPATDYLSLTHNATTATIASTGGTMTVTAVGTITLTPTTNVVVSAGSGIIFGNGTALAVSNGDGSTALTPGHQILGTTKATGSVLISTSNTTNDTTVAPALAFMKSGNAAIGSHTTVASGEILGEILVFGDDGTDFASPAAAISFESDNTVGAGDMPGRIVFKTTTDGGETLAERLRINAAGLITIADTGSLVVGSTAALAVSNGDGSTALTPATQILGTTKADSSLLLSASNTTDTATVAPTLAFMKSGNAAIGSHTTVASGEILGEILVFGDDGTDFASPAASISFEVDAATGTGDMPGRIIFKTTTDAGETLTERLRINNAGLVTIASGNITLTAAGILATPANTATAWKVTDGTTALYTVDTRNTVTVQNHVFDAPAAQTLPNAATAQFRDVSIAAHTVTLAGTTQVTTVNQGAGLYIGAITYNQSGGGVTVDQVSALHIEAVVAGASVTITNNRLVSTSVSGCFCTAAGVWTDQASSAGIKEGISDLDSSVMPALLSQIRPVTYKYDPAKIGTSDLGRQRFGIVAEELPEFLRVPGEKESEGISAAVLSTFGLAAIKYLSARNDALESRLARLEGKKRIN